MDAAGSDMQILAMVPPEEVDGMVSFPGFATPVGSIRFGGQLSRTGGTGFRHYRTYGMFALVLVCGSGTYRDTLGTRCRVKAGDLIVVFPDLPHQYGPEGGDIWDEVFIAFDGPPFDSWRAHGLDPAHPVWLLGERWQERFLSILRMTVTSIAEACAAANAIHLLIADVLAAKPAGDGEHTWVGAAREALGAGTGAPSLQEIATRLGLGYETFRKNFRAATGESPARYRKRMRLNQAALMMQRADLSLDMIAEALGFCDGFHLSKAFKMQHGYSPAEFRRRIHP